MALVYNATLVGGASSSTPPGWPIGWNYPGPPFPPGWPADGCNEADQCIYDTFGYNFGDQVTFEYQPGLNAYAAKTDIPETPDITFVNGANLNATSSNIMGTGGGLGGDSNHEYVPDTWTQKQDLPAVRELSGNGSLDGKGYVTGGTRPPAFDDSCITWDGAAYAVVTNMLEDRAHHDAVAIGGELHVANGDLNAAPAADQRSFNPGTTVWTIRPAPVVFILHPNCAAVMDKAYMVSGQQGALELDFNQEYAFNLAWVLQTPLPSPERIFAGVTGASNALYLMNGQETSNALTDINNEYDPSLKTWRTALNTPRARAGNIAMAIQN